MKRLLGVCLHTVIWSAVLFFTAVQTTVALEHVRAGSSLWGILVTVFWFTVTAGCLRRILHVID